MSYFPPKCPPKFRKTMIDDAAMLATTRPDKHGVGKRKKTAIAFHSWKYNIILSSSRPNERMVRRK